MRKIRRLYGTNFPPDLDLLGAQSNFLLEISDEKTEALDETGMTSVWYYWGNLNITKLY
ncbi:MAG: hypothetical protein QQN41_10345 [Nitrosopumilus sp.]